MQVITSPVASPGTCYKCGSPSKGKYLDFETSIEFYGAFILCHECLGAAAVLLGMVTEDVAAVLKKDIQELIEKNLTLEVEILALRNTVQSLAVANFGHDRLMVVHESLPDSNLPSHPSDPDFVPSVLEDSDNDSEDSRTRAEQLDSGTGTDDESSDDQRMVKLHSDEPRTSDFSFNI